MPKKYFWPATLVTMGLIFLASNLQLLPEKFINLWPVILVVVGLGGLVTADRDEWLVESKSSKVVKKSAPAKSRKKSRK